MKPINSQNQNRWNNKPEVKKGAIGVACVRQHLEQQGYIIYDPATAGAHPFDMLAVKDKKEVIIAEVKAKAKRTYYPDTGINQNNYDEYKAIALKHNLGIFLFFVDEGAGQVYGNWLRQLEIECTIEHGSKILKYPMIQNGIIYFPIAKMVMIKELTEEEMAELKKYSRRSYEYEKQSKETS